MNKCQVCDHPDCFEETFSELTRIWIFPPFTNGASSAVEFKHIKTTKCLTEYIPTEMARQNHQTAEAARDVYKLAHKHYKHITIEPHYLDYFLPEDLTRSEVVAIREKWDKIIKNCTSGNQMIDVSNFLEAFYAIRLIYNE